MPFPQRIRHIHQIHVRAGIGNPQDSVDVEGVDVGVHLEALRRHHLKGFAGLDLLDQVVDDRAVFLDGALEAGAGLGPAEVRNRRRQRLAERRGHHIQPSDRVVIGPVDPLVGAVPVHRVGDQRDGALVVVDGGQVGGQQQQHVREPEIVDGDLGQALEAADEVVGEVPDQAARQRRHPRERARGQQLDGPVQRLQRVAPGRRVFGALPSQTAWPSRTVNADGAPAPMNDQRDHDRPFSADSSRNVPGRLAASFRYADSGVSLSASTLRVTGTTRCSAASARNSSRVVVVARWACTEPTPQIGGIEPDQRSPRA